MYNNAAVEELKSGREEDYVIKADIQKLKQKA